MRHSQISCTTWFKFSVMVVPQNIQQEEEILVLMAINKKQINIVALFIAECKMKKYTKTAIQAKEKLQ